VVFDVGETLLDDTRYWGLWADWLGVPRHTLSALVGAVTVQGHNNVEALKIAKPGFDLAAERQAREDAGRGEAIGERDLYPDVRPALQALRDAGYWVGISGNQTAIAARLLRALDLPADAVTTSGEWGVGKPDEAFFRKVQDWAPGEVHEIVYVGDHPAYDIAAAKVCGLRTAHIRRGPWGYLWHDGETVTHHADWRLSSLTDLPGLLARSSHLPSSGAG
jgi:HAD superfamily hydrolase (TIGR01549 family)